MSIAQVIPMLTEPFVRTGLYATAEQALKHIVLDYIDRQITWAEVEQRRYEQKYRKTFAEWTETLADRATIAEEDDWMEWEAIQDMLKSWRKIKAEVERSRV